MNKLTALPALLGVVAGLAALPSAADASRSCPGVRAAGHTYPVRIVRGHITCTHARKIIRTAIIDVTWPKGWHCTFGHSNDVWALQCVRPAGSHPKVWIRAANPTS